MERGASEQMLVVVGDVFVQIPHRDLATPVMLAAQEAARREDGCLSFTFAEALGDVGHFVVVELWRDQQTLDSHYRSASFARYRQDIEPLLVRESELHVHRVDETVTPLESSGVVTRQDD
jgi:quinol monooxygenase YgiN